MATEPRWTLDELVGRVAATLAGPAYPGAPNRRVRDVPDKRAVRWYATIGLVDRPAAMQGRTALYGPRHLLQIVAIKRRQAAGRSLAEIQSEVTGATNETLRRLAGVSAELLAAPPQSAVSQAEKRPAEPARNRARFWMDRPAAPRSRPDTEDPRADGATVLAAVTLPGGALLILPRQGDLAGRPDDHDVSAIRAAARPLLDLLADRGLLQHEEWSPS
jgi:DNA-binding transcriptional MerR regulator